MNFVKMQGAGNDFIVLDGRAGDRDWPALARTVCDRHLGIGGDGVLVVADSERAAARMRMFNPDGSEAEMCGNGIRCFVKYVVERAMVPDEGALTVETGAGVLDITYMGSRSDVSGVRVSMGTPRLAPSEIPVRVDGPGPVIDMALSVEGRDLLVTCVSMGNPHAVAFIDEAVAHFPLETVGPVVEHHPLFPNRTNFHVARTLARGRIEMRPWERGAGATLACGSGAAAVCVAARLHGLVDEAVRVDLPGGSLDLSWSGEGPVTLEGSAVEVFRGVWPD